MRAHLRMELPAGKSIKRGSAGWCASEVFPRPAPPVGKPLKRLRTTTQSHNTPLKQGVNENHGNSDAQRRRHFPTPIRGQNGPKISAKKRLLLPADGLTLTACNR